MLKAFIFLFLLTNILFAEDCLLLNVDVNISANQEFVDLPVISKQSEKRENHIGYGIHIDDWTVTNYITRIHFKEKLKNNSIIKKNTLVVLTGEYEVEKTVHGTFAHKFFVKEPKEIEYVACGVYIDYYRDLLGEKVRLVGRSFPENYK
jgi:hypothetical protein